MGWGTWEPQRHLKKSQNAIELFWASSGKDPDASHEVTGEHRCEHCCKMFDTAVGARIHESRCEEKPRVGLGQGSRTAKEAWRLKKAEKVKKQEKAKMGQKDLNYVFNFKYLGNMSKETLMRWRPVACHRGEACQSHIEVQPDVQYLVISSTQIEGETATVSKRSLFHYVPWFRMLEPLTSRHT